MNKQQLEQKLNECRCMNDELQQECQQLDAKCDLLRRKNDDLSINNTHFESQLQQWSERYNECHAELIETSEKLNEATSRVAAIERDLRDEQSVISRIRFACAHRIKVAHDCDVSTEWKVTNDGESIPVPVCEEVRFLREIVRLCKSNELPF